MKIYFISNADSRIVIANQGAKIFETHDIVKGWDGTYKSELCPDGVYIWKLNVVAESATVSKTGRLERDLTGSVVLYR